MLSPSGWEGKEHRNVVSGVRRGNEKWEGLHIGSQGRELPGEHKRVG